MPSARKREKDLVRSLANEQRLRDNIASIQRAQAADPSLQRGNPFRVEALQVAEIVEERLYADLTRTGFKERAAGELVGVIAGWAFDRVIRFRLKHAAIDRPHHGFYPADADLRHFKKWHFWPELVKFSVSLFNKQPRIEAIEDKLCRRLPLIVRPIRLGEELPSLEELVLPIYNREDLRFTPSLDAWPAFEEPEVAPAANLRRQVHERSEAVEENTGERKEPQPEAGNPPSDAERFGCRPRRVLVVETPSVVPEPSESKPIEETPIRVIDVSSITPPPKPGPSPATDLLVTAPAPTAVTIVHRSPFAPYVPRWDPDWPCNKTGLTGRLNRENAKQFPIVVPSTHQREEGFRSPKGGVALRTSEQQKNREEAIRGRYCQFGLSHRKPTLKNNRVIPAERFSSPEKVKAPLILQELDEEDDYLEIELSTADYL